MITFEQFLNESKQVGTIYHFTKYSNLIQIIKGQTSNAISLSAFEFVSHNNHFSTTRNFALSDNIFNNDFPLKEYNVRIALDGDKISNHFKIRPIAGLNYSAFDVFSRNDDRITRDKGESEEIIVGKHNNKLNTFKLKDYVIEIQIYKYDKERDEKLYNEAKELLKDTNIEVKLVRKFLPLKEALSNEFLSIEHL